MTGRQKLEAEEQRREIIASQGGKCKHCDRPARFIAHKIPKSIANLKKYGAEVIHHRFNMDGVCALPAHNDKSLIGCNPEAERKLVNKIQLDLGWWEKG